MITRWEKSHSLESSSLCRTSNRFNETNVFNLLSADLGEVGEEIDYVCREHERFCLPVTNLGRVFHFP